MEEMGEEALPGETGKEMQWRPLVFFTNRTALGPLYSEPVEGKPLKPPGT